MNPSEILRLVEALHREKHIDKEIVFTAIELALVSAAKGYYGDEADIEFVIDRQSGEIDGRHGEEPLDAGETIGRIGAQRAKQVIISKIREAERDALLRDYQEQLEQIVTGVVQRNESGTATVSLGNVDAILPRSEQIPGESHHPNERVRAVVFEVRKRGLKVQVVLSRTRGSLVQRLFEQEIPEIAEGVITFRAIAREPGYRSKVAVSSSDQRVDCVGACVGVRGNRIKNIVDELAGERIDIVRYSDDPQELIPNALQPATVDEVILCQMMGRAIVLVAEDQLSLAIGRRGQNVRLASKLCGWDIEIMTQEELEEQINRAVAGFSELEGVDEEIANRLVGEGYLSYDDLSVIEPDVLMEMGGLTADQVDEIVNQAEEKAEEAERAAQEERRRQKDLERQEKASRSAAMAAQLARLQEDPESAEETGEGEEPAETEAASDTTQAGDLSPSESNAEESTATGESESDPAPEGEQSAESESPETAEGAESSDSGPSGSGPSDSGPSDSGPSDSGPSDSGEPAAASNPPENQESSDVPSDNGSAPPGDPADRENSQAASAD